MVEPLNEHCYELAKRLLGAIEALEADTIIRQPRQLSKEILTIRGLLPQLRIVESDLKVQIAHYKMDHRPERVARTDGNTLEQVFEQPAPLPPKPKKQEQGRRDLLYPYIRAWGVLMHSYSYYISEQVVEAEKDGAPQTACYKHNEVWITKDEIFPSTERLLNEWLDG
jgi:hypothetical protein